MVAYKAAAVQRFLKAPPPECRAILLYGPDAGLVLERGAGLTAFFAKGHGEDAEIIRLDDRDFAEDPARLDVELRTQPMFATAKIVRVSAGNRLDPKALKTLLDQPTEHILILEAGNLRPDSGLRKLFEKLPLGAALPCYGDDRGLSGMIDAELEKYGLTIDRETRAYLMSRLGADQAMSRSEVAKLALYAQDSDHVTDAQIAAIVGDSAEIALENFVFGVSGGDTPRAMLELHRLANAGTSRSAAISALARHFMRLYVVAAHQGPGDEGAKKLRPPLHYKRRDQFLAHCRRWGAGRLASALLLIQEALYRARRAPDLEPAFAERLLLALTSKV